MPDLDFQPIPESILEGTGVQCWQARRGPFIYTVMGNPGLRTFEMSISYVPDYVPKGPFDSLKAAIQACNQAANTLEG